MDALRLLAITRKWIRLLVGGVLVAAALAFVFSSMQPKTYEARTTLIVGQSLSSGSPDYSGILASQQLATTYASIAVTRSQLEAVIAKLNLSTTPDELSKEATASVVVGSSLLTITVQDPDPTRAAAIANALASELIAKISPSTGREQDVQAFLSQAIADTQQQIDDTETRVKALLAKDSRTPAETAELTTLQSQLVTLRSAYATMLGMAATAGATNTLSVVDPAFVPASPIGPRTLLNVLLAAVLGLVAAAGAAALSEYFRDSIGSSDDAEQSGGTLLATVGVLRMPAGVGQYPLVTANFPRSGAAEGYRTLRANLEFASVDQPLKSLLVTSAQPGEGKTLTAINIAVSWAQVGRRVLLIDADLRLPAIHTAFSIKNEIGLTTALVLDGSPLERLAVTSGQPNLWLLPTGPLPPNAAELLSSGRMRSLLEAAEQAYDLVVLDSPPLGAVADAAVLGAAVSSVVLVVDAERGKRRALRRARVQLERAGADVIGIVLNRASAGRGLDQSTYYGSYPRTPAEGTTWGPQGDQAASSEPASTAAPRDEEAAPRRPSSRAASAAAPTTAADGASGTGSPSS